MSVLQTYDVVIKNMALELPWASCSAPPPISCITMSNPLTSLSLTYLSMAKRQSPFHKVMVKLKQDNTCEALSTASGSVKYTSMIKYRKTEISPLPLLLPHSSSQG